MKEIQLTQGKVALVDDEDFEYLSQWKWYANKSSGNYYAITTKLVNGVFFNYKLLMHRVIMNEPYKLSVDHINHNTLDNRKCNLRVCTHAENMYNNKLSKNNTTGFKGVRFNKNSNKYLAYIGYQNKDIFLGSYKTIIEAAEAYNKAANKFFGKFANLNKID